MRTEDLDYELDPALIATRPAQPRDAARLLVVDRARATCEHRLISDLPEFLMTGDSFVLNTTSVARARVEFERVDTGGRVEGLLVPGASDRELHCEAWLRPARRLSAGVRLRAMGQGGAGDVEFEVRGRVEDRVALQLAEGQSVQSIREALARVGQVPLPPYILAQRRLRSVDQGNIEACDADWYATVFAKSTERASVAAPTAGLHLTNELLSAMAARGARRIDVELQVGAGTFQPVSAETLEEHRMHEEWRVVSQEAQRALCETRATGGRIFAVGTTTCRTLESLPEDANGEAIVAGPTDLLIQPGHDFRWADALLTNFHLPRSTLLALVAAYLGLEKTRAIYREAIARGYRFYSYGDAMLIL